ncbi:uncharacterized protein IAS62_001449 [Cryptococcus decagattii]|uniref:Plasma membrane proteolipid 3 n=1 Tax=Cryptococcus decagattii TaxID=1859122 RepID=A0ABZ2AP66_9TREE
MAFTCSDIFKIILAIILPPLGVFLERGCNVDFLINILLTILGYIPDLLVHCLLSMGGKEALLKQHVDTPLIGIIHALYIILKY